MTRACPERAVAGRSIRVEDERVLELMSRRWHLVVLRGVIAILFGIIAIVWPGITVLALALLWGTYMLLDGIASIAMGMGRGTDRMYMIILGVVQIAAAIRLRKVIRNEWFLVISGVVTLVLGLLLIVQPAEGAIALI